MNCIEKINNAQAGETMSALYAIVYTVTDYQRQAEAAGDGDYAQAFAQVEAQARYAVGQLNGLLEELERAEPQPALGCPVSADRLAFMREHQEGR